MTNNNLNKKFFTSADSPVPLIPTDMAWDNMHQKLEQEMPEEKKRRLFFWIPRFVGVMFTILFTGAAVIIWRGQHLSKTLQVKNENGTLQYPKDSVTASTFINNNPGTVNARDAQPVATVKESIASSNNNESQVNANNNVGSTDVTENKRPPGLRTNSVNTRTTKNIQQAFIPVPALTDNDQNGDNAYLRTRPKRKGYQVEKNNRHLTSATARAENDGTLPFVFSQQIVVTDTISVQTERSLPGVLFQSPVKAGSEHKNAFWADAGVQWNIPVPFAGYNYYLKGPDGKDQAYRLVLPGVWFSINKNRQRIMATLNPFVSTPMPDKDYGTGMVPINDSMQVYAQKRMIKMFGYQAGLQYTYRLTGHWWLGSGVDGNWWRKGLVLAKQPDSFSVRNLFLYGVTPKTEEKMRGFQLSANLALGYQYKDWEAVMQVSTPFSTTKKGISSPIWLRLSVRWRLMNRRIQQEE